MPDITIAAKDGGGFSAYVAMPATLPAPAIIVIQEIFGVNAGIREKCDWLAGQGFIAAAPDLFWRLEPGVQLTDQTQGEWDKAFDLMNRFDTDQGIEDLKATKHAFRGHAQSTGKVGCLGYCLGGKLAFLLGCRSDAAASVSYYGVGIEALTDEAKFLSRPMMLHIAENDKFVSREARHTIRNALNGNPHVTIHAYPGMDHAFTRVGGAHYDENAAALADERTVAFFKKHL